MPILVKRKEKGFFFNSIWILGTLQFFNIFHGRKIQSRQEELQGPNSNRQTRYYKLTHYSLHSKIIQFT